jgi:integrase
VNGKSVWKNCKTVAEAQRLEREFMLAHNDIDAEILSLTTMAKVEVLRILRECIKSGISLTHLHEYYITHHVTEASLTVYECARRYLDELESSGRRENYFKTMRQWLAQFTDQLGYLKIPAVTQKDIKPIYAKVLERSKSTWKNRCSSFFSWAIKNSYCVENPAEKLQTPILDRKRPHILTVEQCRTLLSKCPIKSLPGLVLMLFAGIRPFEAKQVTHPAISFDKQSITIDGEIAKTRSFRVIKMSDNLMAWINYCKKEGLRFPFSPALKQMTEQFAMILNLKTWPRDCLRHTAASYMLMRDKSADKVALELGNSPQILHRHYKNLVSEEDCAAFWEIMPDVRKKIFRRERRGFRRVADSGAGEGGGQF